MADLDRISMILGEIKSDVRGLKDDVKEIKTQVREVRDFKIRIVAWCTAASAGVTFLVTMSKDAIAGLFRGN